MKPLAITGVGVVSPIGIGRAQWRAALNDPASAAHKAFSGTPTVLSPEKVPNALAAEVWGFDPALTLGDKGLRNFDRLTKLMIVAAKEALEDSGLKRDGAHVVTTGDRVGVAVATAYGSLDVMTELNLVAELEDPRFLNPNRFPNTVANSSAGYVAIWEDLRAPNVTVVDGNCGALDAVLAAETHLACRRADAFIVGGGEVLSEPLFLAFRKLGLLAEAGDNCQPGYGESVGVRLAEGAAFLCVENLAMAEQRKARVLAEIVGYGSAFEPPSSEALVVNASADAVTRAIDLALADAGLNASDIDVVSSGVSGLPQFDRVELSALKARFGEQIAIVAPKAIYGESLGAGGAFAMAQVIEWFDGAPVAPLINGMVNGSTKGTPRHVLVSTVGFYGNVSAVVLRASSRVG